MYDKFNTIDSKEIDLPETTLLRDIESRVFQAMVLQVLNKIEGVSLSSSSLIDSILGREAHERYTGISIEQDQKMHSISIRIEINIKYGISIPQKAEEIQNKIVEEISTLSGLHVSKVHVVFKNLILDLPKVLIENSDDEKNEDDEKSEEEYEGF